MRWSWSLWTLGTRYEKTLWMRWISCKWDSSTLQGIRTLVQTDIQLKSSIHLVFLRGGEKNRKLRGNLRKLQNYWGGNKLALNVSNIYVFIFSWEHYWNLFSCLLILKWLWPSQSVLIIQRTWGVFRFNLHQYAVCLCSHVSGFYKNK